MDIIRVYFQFSVRSYAGTDDSERFDVFESADSKLLTNEIPRSEYANWYGGMSGSSGEDGGSFKVFVVTDLEGNVIPERLLATKMRG